MKNYRNYYSNQAKRRADANIRQIKNGSPSAFYTAASFMAPVIPTAAPDEYEFKASPANEQAFQLPESVTIVDRT